MKKNIFLLVIFVLFFSVAAHAEEEKTSEKKFGFLGRGRATEIVLNDEHCGFLPDGCHAEISGNWRTLDFGVGEFSAVLDTAWQNSIPNGLGGYCAPISGTATLDSTDGISQMFVSIQGMACDILFSSETLPHQYNCRFVITGGTGEYEEAGGSGNLNAFDYGPDRVLFFVNGKIKT